MRNRLLLVGLLLLALALPVTAQDDPPVLAFHQKFTQLFEAGDLAALVALVEAQPTEAEQAFHLFEAQLVKAPSTDQDELARLSLSMNLIARTFQVRLKRDELAARVEARGLLVPDAQWEGTPLAGTTAAVAPSAGTGAVSMERIRAESQVFLSEIGALQAEIDLASDRANFVARLEDMPSVYLMSRQFHEELLPRFQALIGKAKGIQADMKRVGLGLQALEETFGKLAEQQEYQAQVFRTAEVVQLANLGLYTEAAARGEALKAELSQPGAREFLSIVLVQVGRSGGQPDLVRRSLEGLTPTAVRDRFYVESVRFEDEFRGDPDMSPSRFLARHDEVLPVLQQVEPADVDRYVGYGIRIWALAAADVAFRLRPEDPQRARVLQVLDADLATLAARAGLFWEAPVLHKDAVRLNPEWNPQLLFALLDLRLDLAARARETGDAARAAQELAAVQARLPELEAAVPGLEAAAGKLFSGGKVQPDVLRGSLSRIPGRAEEEKGRQAGLKGARASFERALQRYERAAAPLPRLQLLPDYALSILEAGDPAAARKVADGAVAEAERSGQRAALSQALFARGRVQAAQGRTSEAVADLAKGAEVLEKLLTELGTGSSEARRSRDAAVPFYELLARLQAESGKPEDAFATVARKQQVEGFGATAPSNPLTAQIQAMRSRMAGLEQEQVALSGLPESAEVQVLRSRNSELLASTRSDFYARLGELYQAEPAYQRLAIRPVVYGQIQSTLPPNTVVLQYLPSGKQMYVFVLTRESMRVRRVDVTEAELGAGVQEFRARMSAFTAAVEGGTAAPTWADDGSEAWRKQVRPMRDLLARLHSWLVEPVEEDLQGKEVVAVIPTGDLMYLPFASLGRSVPGAGDLEFLAERKQVVTLVKASDLLQVGFDERGVAGPVVAFGNPDGSLAAAEQEVKALQGVYPDAQVFVGGQASYEHLKGVVGAVGYLHLATHGVLDSTPAQNHLVLAGLPEDRLTMRDIAELQLGPSTRLVTLSGCQTAMNSPAPETELLQSVADAFGFAGSPAVVASLWWVADESTRDLMVEFYRRLQAGESRAQALQGAEKRLMEDPARRHPFYWAPFVLIGDWR